MRDAPTQLELFGSSASRSAATAPSSPCSSAPTTSSSGPPPSTTTAAIGTTPTVRAQASSTPGSAGSAGSSSRAARSTAGSGPQVTMPIFTARVDIGRVCRHKCRAAPMVGGSSDDVSRREGGRGHRARDLGPTSRSHASPCGGWARVSDTFVRRYLWIADTTPPCQIPPRQGQPATPSALPPAALRGRARPLDLVERPGEQRAHRIGAGEVGGLTAGSWLYLIAWQELRRLTRLPAARVVQRDDR